MNHRLLWIAGVSLPSLALAVACSGDLTVVPIQDDAGQPDTSVVDSSVKDSGTKDTSQPVDAADANADDAADVSVVDAAPDVTSADAGVIANLSGLVLWLDANKGVTTNGSDVTAWADQSGQKNDAKAGKTAPTLNKSGINSLPSVTFTAQNSSGLVITDSSSLQWGTGDYCIAVVSKFDNDPKNGAVTGLGAWYAKADKTSGILFFGNNLNPMNSSITAGLFAAENGQTFMGVNNNYNDGTARLYLLLRTANVLYARVNGSQVGTFTESAPISVSAANNNVFVGLFVNMNQNIGALDGDIAEMIAVKGAVSSGDLSAVESYFKSKYAL